ncbi:hypothetical protein L3V59_12695 [Burkholderia aenigmatica]|uniref:hypothetical protein n=1 Tax=Burkholderia aenigmatica TaxID=2015348 RepID=UPI001F2CB6B1|nr:hypothetical protein [Burkholderia aenigmatica]UKD10536.1 hypothetical protein L3V59_12695 [Burkholderia aenigmatica]
MGILLRDDQASYRTNAKGMIFPISDVGLELVGVFGDSLAASCRNFAPGKSAFTPVGSPVVNANSIELTGAGGAFLQTDMAHTPDLTLIAVSRVLDNRGSLVLTNFHSKSQVHADTTVGSSLYLFPPASGETAMSSRFSYAVTDGTTSTAVTTLIGNDVPVGQYQFQCARFSTATKLLLIDNLTSGKSAKSSPVTSPVDTGEPFRIGSSYQPNPVDYPGRCEVVAVIGMSRAITDAEMSTLYKFWRGYCERRGIVI